MHDSPRQRATQALRQRAPALADSAVREFAHGLDNMVFTAGDLVLRAACAGDVVREAGLLQLVAPYVSLPIPAPCFVDPDNAVLAYPLLPGRPLLGRRAPPGSARRLGLFLRELHAVDLAEVADLVPTEDADPGEWLQGLDGPLDLLRLVQAHVPPATRQRVLAHNDLGAEHVLERDGVLTGVIDWSDAAVTDPALDLARLYRDFGPGFLYELLEHYGPVAAEDLRRVDFYARCAAMEDLAYAEESGRGNYGAAAERSLGWLRTDLR